ncbi:hypothetical protein LPJ56_006551 [Coemansia sp. RSA 2599]|nr:hypothetical protein LPJ75_006588 [Coemansia sp. RSA 2598]KAJ1805381.1 hypothetical protein LPJ56_006551 [Coemansia sp. RSA 2599]
MASRDALGLAGAPVTKLWLATVGVASTSLTPLGKLMPFRRLVASWAFGDIMSALVVLNVVFQTRPLERMYGSRRFASQLVASLVVSRALLALLRYSGLAAAAARDPYDLVASCLLQFCIHVPSTRYLRRWGVGVGDNWLTWPWLVFAASRRTGASWCALAGALAALVVDSDVAGLKSWRLPAWMGRVAARALGSRRAPAQSGQQQAEAVGAALAQAEAQADEQQVSLLMSMFPDAERTQVVQALLLAANDANRAVTILLDSRYARAPRS